MRRWYVLEAVLITANVAVKYLKREDGLPSGQIHDLAQDQLGRLWIATPSGLASFDGSRVRTLARSAGLKSHGLRSLGVAPNGDIIVGSDAGWDRVRKGKIQSLPAWDADWTFGFVECIACVRDAVWLGTSAGLVKYAGQSVTQVAHDRLRDGLITAIQPGADGSLWVAPAAGDLMALTDGSWSAPESQSWQQVGKVWCLARGPDNHILVGGQDGFAEVTRTGDVVADHEDAHGERVTALLLIGDELWVARGKQLLVYRQVAGRWRALEVIVEGHFFNTLLSDSFGNVWAATESHGVAKVSVLRKAIRRISLSAEQAVFTIAAARKTGELVAAGDGAGWYVECDVPHRAEEIRPLADAQIWDVLVRQDGAVYAATASGLKYVDASGTLAHLGADHPVLSRPNRCLLRHDGGVYVGTLGGCAFVDADLSVNRTRTRNDEPLGYVYTLAVDRNGKLWAGTLGNGLWVQEEGVFHRFEHELLSKTGNTYAIDVHDDQRMVFVQDDKLFLLSAHGDLRQLAKTDDPIAGWTVRWAPDGSIWTGSASGLSQYNSEDGHRMRQIIALLGLSNWEFTTSRSLYAVDNLLYCGVNSGLLTVDVHAIDAISDAPEVMLDAVVWGQTDAQYLDGRWVVPFGRWNVSIDVFASWYIEEDDLFFRFRLSGFDEDWRALDRRAGIRFNSLPPGDYVLEAQAYNRLVGFGPLRTLMCIRVLKPRWANRALIAPFTAFSALRRMSAALMRNRSLNEKNLELERIVSERTADLEQARRRLEVTNRELASQSITDALTGISNRRHFDAELAAAITQAAKTGDPLSLLLMDVDHFKAYNDLYGHAKGDDCLSFVARKLVSILYRPTDLLARYGGEEFAVILPQVGVGGAMSLAERLRYGVENLAMEHKGAAAGRVTVSIGVTTLAEPAGMTITSQTSTQLIESADAALYAAKGTGRNQCAFGDAKL